MSDKISVMIIDDSASVRAALSGLVREDPGLELEGTAVDPFDAAAKMKKKLPDVLLLDLHMPKMDGLTFLKKIMKQHPMPVVVVSSFASEGSEATMKALEAGAAEVLTKPKIGTPEERQEAGMRLSDAIRAAAASRGRRRKTNVIKAPGKKHTADVILKKGLARAARNAPPLIAIGASTGGTDALREVFDRLPGGLPPIAVVQHMPEGFTRAFSDRLNRTSQVEIFEAEDRALILPGQAAIAKGDHHMLLHPDRGGYRIELVKGPTVARHRPSVDVLFRSAAQVAGPAAIGVIMTGMGDDGAAGLGEMRDTGALTIAQDEASSVVYGMPREAFERGAAQRSVSLLKIPAEIQNWASGRSRQVAS